MGMLRWVKKISCTHKRSKFGSSYFGVEFIDSNPILGPLYQSFHHLSSCFNEFHASNRGRGERRGCWIQMCMHFGSAFPLYGFGDYGAYHCFGSVGVQVSYTVSNTSAQSCRNLWQKKMLTCVGLKYSTCPNLPIGFGFWKSCRTYASVAESGRLMPMAKISIPKPHEANRKIGDDDGGEIIDDKQGNDVERYDKSEQPVLDFHEVERVYKVVEDLFALDRNMEAVLDQCGVDLSHSLVYHVLSRFSHAPKPALRFFNWAAQQEGYLHNSLTYNMMLRILGRTKQFVTMRELLEEMGRKGSVLTKESFEIAVKAFAAGKEMKKALQVFTLMERYNFGANINNLNFLLDALGRAKLAKEAQMLFERMREGYRPDAKTYTVLLSGWCNVKNLIQAGKLWNEMVDEGFKPDLVAHNIMVEGLFKGKKKDEALKLFGIMKRNGPFPNTRSYTIVISALCNLNMMEEAFKLFAEMQENGCATDAAVYTCLITGYGNLKKLDEAYELLDEMKAKGIPHDCQVYNALMKLMVDLYKPDQATELYEKMIQCDIEPTIHTYNMLIKLYFATKKSDMAVDIWNQMVRNGCSPDVNSYTVFIGGLIREGRSQEACTYLEGMIEKGMKAPHFDYDKLAAIFSREGNSDIFEELAEKMKQTGKLDIVDVFIRHSQKTKKRIKKKYVASVGMWSNGEFARLPQRQPRLRSQNPAG